jgi:hypothetical protein
MAIGGRTYLAACLRFMPDLCSFAQDIRAI